MTPSDPEILEHPCLSIECCRIIQVLLHSMTFTGIILSNVERQNGQVNVWCNRPGIITLGFANESSYSPFQILHVHVEQIVFLHVQHLTQSWSKLPRLLVRLSQCGKEHGWASVTGAGVASSFAGVASSFAGVASFEALDIAQSRWMRMD